MTWGRALGLIGAMVVVALILPSNTVRADDDLDPETVARAVEEYLDKQKQPTSSFDEFLADFSLSGDLRLRHESQVKRDSQRDRHRERVRLRLGATYRLSDGLVIGTRLVTGDRDDPNSPHSTFGDGFDDIEISLDRAYARYVPPCADGKVWLVAGKFSNPIARNPVYGELVWDADVQPEGAAVGARWESEGALRKVELMLGQYVLLEQGNASDTSISAGQVAATVALTEEVRGVAALGYFHYGSTSPDGSTEIVSDSRGNQTRDDDGDGTADAYVSSFGIVNPIAAVSFRCGVPVTISTEAIVNVRTGDRKHGYAVGAAVGSTGEVGGWKAYYQWQRVAQEAIFSAFAEDDFLLATNYKSHVFGAQYRALDAVTLHAWALVSSRERTGQTATTDSDSAQWSLRFDVNIGF